MAKFQFQEHVIYNGAQFPDYEGESGMVTDARETYRGQQYLVALDSGAQILVAEDDLSLPDAPHVEEAPETPEAVPAGATPHQEVASEPEAAPDAPEVV